MERYSVALFEQFLVLTLYLRFCLLKLDPNCGGFVHWNPTHRGSVQNFQLFTRIRLKWRHFRSVFLCAKGGNLVWFFIISLLIFLVKWATLRSGPIKILQKTKKIFWKQQKSKSDMRFRFFYINMCVCVPVVSVRYLLHNDQ